MSKVADIIKHAVQETSGMFINLAMIGRISKEEIMPDVMTFLNGVQIVGVKMILADSLSREIPVR